MNVPIQLNNVSLECQYGDNGVPVTDLKWSPETPPPDRVHFEELDLENVGEMALDGDESRKVLTSICDYSSGRTLDIKYYRCNFGFFQNVKATSESLASASPFVVWCHRITSSPRSTPTAAINPLSFPSP